jgi:hypothetical protein
VSENDGKTVSAGLPSTWRFKENRVNDSEVVGWASMGGRERLAACLAAALAHWPLDPERMHYNPRTDVVFVTRPRATDPEKEDVVVRAGGELHETCSRGVALLGGRWGDVERACALTQARASAVLQKAFR